MRTVDPELWSKGLRKRIPTAVASFHIPTNRQGLRGPQLVPNYEKILRKSIKDTLKEFLKHSSISCIEHGERHHCERFLYFFFFIVSISSLATIFILSSTAFYTKPIIVSLESTQYPAYQIPFPAVGLCSVNLISKRAAMLYSTELKAHIEALVSERFNASRMKLKLPTVEDMYQNVRRLGYLFDYQIDDYDGLIRMLQVLARVDKSLETIDLSSLLTQLSPRCEDMLVRCSWQGRRVDCSEIFTPRKTIYGTCCTFNYVRTYNAIGQPLGITRYPVRMLGTGPDFGLSVIVKSDIDDYAYPKHNSIGTDVLIFSPFDFAEQISGSVDSFITLINYTAYFDLSAVTQYSTESTKMYDHKIRGCRFRDELPSRFHGHYSMSECLTSCRRRTTFNLCRCAPHTAYYEGQRPKCFLNDIPCLHKHKEKFMYIYPEYRKDDESLLQESQNSLFCPECHPDCEGSRYSTKQYITRHKDSKHSLRGNFTEALDLTNMTVIHVFFSNEDQLLYKIDVLYQWYEFIGFMGSLIAFFSGVSILSVLEIIYFCFYRFFVVWNRNKMSYLYYNKRY